MIYLGSNHLKLILIIVGMIGFSACTSTPNSKKPIQLPKKIEQPTPKEQTKVVSPEGIKIIPYDRPEITREQLDTVVAKQTPAPNKFDNGSQLPAFKNLMLQTQNAFQKSQWLDAEKYALQAQRIAPQSSETYMYLAMIANHKNEAKNAESLARRGLSYAQTVTMKRQLWQIILKSAQLQRNSVLMTEAQNQIKNL